MRNLLLSIAAVSLLLASCKKDPITSNPEGPREDGKYPETTIYLKTKGYFPSILNQQLSGTAGIPHPLRPGKLASGPEIIKDSAWQDDFGRTLYAETTEIAMLQNTAMNRLIFAGALIQGNSLADLNIKPIADFQHKVKPIRVSVSIPAKTVSGTITTPSLSATRDFVSDVLSQNNIGEQISSYSFTMERFTAYDELKLAFGSNVKTGALFFGSESSTTETQHKISKRSGLYVKFIQKNFSLDLDLPTNGQLMDNTTDMNALNKLSPLYVSSITYGRMGIMAIETDSSYESTYAAYNTAFKALFVSGSTSLTREQQTLIDKASMKILLVGTNGSGSVQTVNGFDAFVQLATKGTKFSASEPGVPIYYSLSYLGDNSIVKTKFKIDVALDPLYARIEYKDIKRNYQNLNSQGGGGSYTSGYDEDLSAIVTVNFYSNPQGTVATFPAKDIRIFFKTYTKNVGSGYDLEGSFDWDYLSGEKTDYRLTPDRNSFAYLSPTVPVAPLMLSYHSDISGLEDFGSGGSARFARNSWVETFFELQPGSFYKILSSQRPSLNP
ncbi:thiol-activated cytolysin family protein [Chitinophaga nivalis]|uniref:Thiol-activated cytolysin family protein n=1 Tax=Chitinophaga nivalis TaxID=2991709 RepID=A0ABT3IM43_9BACT|nr:thiol-activated cytolysin family protein [Chitinophaga nivalis]MCW3465278.1 thiol-activated cytolysin family protein [Chitinophaga nivalis]MCW3485030.1 thiol-activated cytolysin family protein [Chitinophaga nivalis]